jgi:hypothetical protein
MSEELRDIILNGFLVYPSNGKFIVKKEAVPESNFTIEAKECDSYGQAIEFAIEMLKKPRILKWSGVVRYNRGLGIEYKNLSFIESENYEKACEIAKLQVEDFFKNQKVIISEIKVRLKSK